MQRAILSSERPRPASLAAHALLTLAAFAGTLAGGAEHLSLALAAIGLWRLVLLVPELVILAHYRNGFPGRTVLKHGIGELRIWSRGGWVAVNPREVADWFTRGDGRRRSVNLRLRDGRELALKPRIADPAAEREALRIIERYLGTPGRDPARVAMAPYASCL